MTLTDAILTGLVMLLGEEDVDYLMLERDMDGWERFGWLNRN